MLDENRVMLSRAARKRNAIVDRLRDIDGRLTAADKAVIIAAAEELTTLDLEYRDPSRPDLIPS